MKKLSYEEFGEKYFKTVIFLDIDGVIIPYINDENCPPKGTKLGYGNMYFTSDIAINVLKSLIEEFDAKIVLSFSWRGFEPGLAKLYQFLLDKYNSFLILEDEPVDFDNDKLLLDNTCQPNLYKGLVEKDFYSCRGIINRQLMEIGIKISGKSKDEFMNELFGK